MLGFIMLNSPTLFDALSNLQRYHRVLGDGEDFEIVRTGSHFMLRFRETDKALRGLRHNSEYIAAIIVRACRDMSRKTISPLRAEFMHGRPNGKISYADYLGCSVRFHASWDALVYDAQTMNLPVFGADSALLDVLERACQKILGQAPKKHDIVHDVRGLMIDGLARGTVSLNNIARKANMSGKTLERRLAEKGTSFRVLLEDIRNGLAKHYLGDTDLRLDQIAYLTGYSEPAALVRAFKRWTGTTPMQYRARRR